MPGGDAGAAEMPGLPSAFPWREAPDNRGVRGLVERAMYSVMQHQHRRFLRAATKLDDADDDAFLVSEHLLEAFFVCGLVIFLGV